MEKQSIVSPLTHLTPRKTMKFRSYVPTDETLRQCTSEPPENLLKKNKNEFEETAAKEMEDVCVYVFW